MSMLLELLFPVSLFLCSHCASKLSGVHSRLYLLKIFRSLLFHFCAHSIFLLVFLGYVLALGFFESFLPLFDFLLAQGASEFSLLSQVWFSLLFLITSSLAFFHSRFLWLFKLLLFNVDDPGLGSKAPLGSVFASVLLFDFFLKLHLSEFFLGFSHFSS